MYVCLGVCLMALLWGREGGQSHSVEVEGMVDLNPATLFLTFLINEITQRAKL